MDFLAIKDFVPNGYCLNWDSLLLWLHVVSDSLVVLAYYSIPISLIYFIRQRKDIPYPRLFGLFGVFILACGTTHLLSIVIIWLPVYWLEAYVKIFTAVVSIAAAISMVRIIPHALRLPSVKQLKAEIARREVIEQALRDSETKFRTLFEASNDALILLEQQVFFECNSACLSMFGCTDKTQLLNKHPAEISPPYQACGSDSLTLANHYIQQALAIGHQRFEWLHQRMDNHEIFSAEVLLNKIELDGKTVIHSVVRDISERKLVEQRLKQSELTFRKLITTLRVGVMVHDADTKVVLHNPYALELFNLTQEQLLGRSVLDNEWLILHEDGTVFSKEQLPVAKAAATGETVQNIVLQLFRPNKQDWVWLLMTATPQFNDDNSLLHIICSFIDITRRKEAEQRLQQSEMEFRHTFEYAPIGVATLSLKGQFLKVNRTYCDLLGYERDELVGMNFIRLTQTEDRRQHFRYMQQLISGSIFNFSLVKQYVRKDQQRIWCSLSVRLILQKDGSPDYVIATLENINARKQAENAMIAARNQLQSTLNAIPDLLLELGLDGHCYDVYTKHSDLLISPLDQLIDKNITDVLPSDITDVILSALYEAKEHEHSHGKQFVFTPLYGQSLWIELSVAIKQGINAGSRFVVLWLDITQRKLAELQLQANEERLNLSQEYGGIGSWEADLINNQQIWSKITYQLIGNPDIPKPRWEDFIALVHPDDRELVNTATQAHLTDRTKYDVEYRVILANNVMRWMRSIGRAEYTDGIASRFIGIVQDITERKLMEAELQRSNADLEQFAYAISHDMRQPLRMVSNYLMLIEQDIGSQLNEEQRQFLNFAIDGAKRMDSMILSLLDYSRVGHRANAIRIIASHQALDEALNFLTPDLQINGGIVEIQGDWPDLFVNPDELTRLLQNLIGNALKYHEVNQSPHVEVKGHITATAFKVTIRDDGIGIDPQHIEQLFKVFSRLQPRSRFEGTGVGLALCRKIVEYYGGTIGVESAGEGQGSVFWFELPWQRVGTNI